MDHELYLRGIELFNAEQFFAAHEVLEDVWRAAPVAEKRFLQGLVQIAVGFVHHSRGNAVGALALLKRGVHNLVSAGEFEAGIDVAALLQAINLWQDALTQKRTCPAFPKVRLRDGVMDRRHN